MYSSVSDNNLKISDAFKSYCPSKYSFPAHPAEVVEAVSLSFAKSPNIYYDLKLLHSSEYKKESLSCVQLEAISLAYQKHLEKTDENYRYGFFLGDSAGIGKGRTISGLFLENYLNNNKKGVWLTVSKDLFVDCGRDCSAVSLCLETFDVHSLKDIESLPDEKILCMTYHGLSSKKRDKNGKTRFEYLSDWLGKDSEALVVLDESHRAKDDESGIGKVIKKIQFEFKNLRILYSTATAAANAYDFSYMSRLGLFSVLESSNSKFLFSSADDFAQTMEKRGISAMESLAIELKENGLLITRQLSFKDVETLMIKVDLDDDFQSIYDESCYMWSDLYEYLLELMPSENGNKKKTLYSIFWMNCLNYFQTLITSSKIKTAVKFGLQRAMESDNSLVFGLQRTGDSQLSFLGRRGVKNLNRYFSHAASILAYVLDKLFKIDVLFLFKSSTDGDTDENESSLNDSSDEIDEEKTNINFKIPLGTRNSEFKERFSSLYQKLPQNPLDDLISQLGGPTVVAELTGRKFRSTYNAHTGEYQAIPRKKNASDSTTNTTEKDNFQNGDKRFAIISDAASTGTSLHSDHSCKNKGQRIHVTLECAFSAEKYIQQLGRTHRSNQLVPPIYVFLVSPVPAEDRFVWGIADKLSKLGAMTKGDRNTTQAFYETEKCLNTFYGDLALTKFLSNINSDNVEYDLNVSVEEIKEWLNKVGLQKEGNRPLKPTISRFLNRVLCCPLNLQKQILNYFYHLLDEEVQYALNNKSYNAGVLEYHIPERASIELLNKSEYFYRENKIIYNSVQIDYGVSWEQLIDLAVNFTYLRFLIYEKKGTQILLAFESNDDNVYALQPSDCRMLPLKSFLDLPYLDPKNQSALFVERKNNIHIWPETAKKIWNLQYQQMSSGECIHMFMEKSCTNNDCSTGSRVKYHGVVSGSLNFIWSQIENIVGNVSFPLVRVICESDNEKLVGVLLDSEMGDHLCTFLEESNE